MGICFIGLLTVQKHIEPSQLELIDSIETLLLLLYFYEVIWKGCQNKSAATDSQRRTCQRFHRRQRRNWLIS